MPYVATRRRSIEPSLNLSLFHEPTPVMPVPVVKSFNPTDEQIAIGKGFLAGDNLCINAYAGTGKSSTLRYLASLSDRRGELWCFNSRNAAEAKKSFPETKVQCFTSHSRAHRALKLSESPLRGKVSKKWPTWKIAREFGITGTNGISDSHVAHAALTSLRRWMHSADPMLTPDHCWDALRSLEWFKKRAIKEHELMWPSEGANDLAEWKEKILPSLAIAELNRYRGILFTWAQELWAAMWQVTSDFPLEHDAYLKAWQLQKPKLRGIKYLMIDECQDTNACVIDIVLNQDCQIIAVGDKQQGLYGFRGAVATVMENFPGRLFYLTLSHRFGDEVAQVANAILQVAYPGIPLLRGSSYIKSTIGGIDHDRPYAAIGRTNGALFELAIEAVNQQQSIHALGSLKEPIAMARSVYGLYADLPKLVTHPDIKDYEDWETVLDEAELNSELNRYVGLVKTYDQKLPDICTMLESAGEAPIDKAQVVLSTSHRVKGFEFPQVRMLNDYFRIRSEDDADGVPQITGPDEEFNNLYVNATRAVHRLQPNAITMEILDAA